MKLKISDNDDMIMMIDPEVKNFIEVKRSGKMVEYTEKEWKKMLTEKFGENILNWKFKCPACGKITSGKEFKEVGAKPSDMYQKCIGNFKGQGEPDKENNKDGCNWKAYGLFKLGDVVIKENGNEIDVFPIGD